MSNNALKTAGELIAAAQKQIKCVNIAEAKVLLESDIAAVILDVREVDSAAESKLAQSHNISRGLIEMKVPNLCPDPGQLILTHCGGGGRASLAALSLQQMGYTNVAAITAKYDDIKAELG